MDQRFQYNSLTEVADHLSSWAVQLGGDMQASYAALAPTAVGIAIKQIRQVTPSGENNTGGSFRSDKLMNSTIEDDMYTGPELISFDIAQPAESNKNMDGSGGGNHYVQWVLPPGRGPIDAPSSGPYSTGKKVLWSPHFGPAKHVAAYPGNPYPLLANGPIQTAYGSMLERWGTDQLGSLFS